jgi:hypothetical protein
VRRDLGRGPAMMKIAETSETMGDVGRPIKIVKAQKNGFRRRERKIM